ncbi:MAG: GDP-mannose 4,6-dehydratase [Candidatus Aenigmarchaeota archaeon]|nr:GDP-mannose 4,6-dehydratase [Candidatus Aenigmarchaeota archaeon]
MQNQWKDKNVLILGVTGFVGSWLAETLSSEKFGSNVFGFVRRQSVPSRKNISHIMDKMKIVPGDLNDMSSIVDTLKKNQIDIVFHLAAQSYVTRSFESPTDTYYTNVIGTANVLEAARHYDRLEKIHFAGSSEEYGLVIKDDAHYKELLGNGVVITPPPLMDGSGNAISELPIKETNYLRPLSPYAVSKVAGDYMCFCHHRAYGIPVVRTRAFNHEGPRRGEEFVTSVIAKQVAEGKKYGKRILTIGNPDPVRDYSDIRDIIAGYILAIEKGKNGEVYNLCSGKGWRIGDVVEMAIKTAGLKGKMSMEIDRTRFRKAEVELLIGDFSKAKKELGWEPKIGFEQTIKDQIQYWEKHI